MRHLFCPICASEINWRLNEFDCLAGCRLSPKLGNAIKNAVYGLAPPADKPRKPTLAPYLWCPNCTAEFGEYNDKQKRMKCAACSLELTALAYFELMEIKASHEDPE